MAGKVRKLIFATSNRHKFAEVAAVVKPFGIRLMRKEFDFVENESESPRTEAVNKARQAYAKFRRPLIAEDTGFFFNAYNRFPGTHSRRIFEAIGYDGFFRLLRGKDRSAYAEVVIAHVSRPGCVHTFSGKMRGKITTRVFRPKLDVMPYERVFRPDGGKRVIAQMGREEKNALSHRAIASKKLARFLAKK